MFRHLLRTAGAALLGLALATGCGPGEPSGAATESPVPQASADVPTPRPALDTRGLPPEAAQVLAQIAHGGPFAYRKDGTVFHNRERRLPERPSGYYREYTVPTPGERTRGARRIVAGGQPPHVYYYTSDHYRSFQRIPERP